MSTGEQNLGLIFFFECRGIRACLVAGSSDCKDRAEVGQMGFGGAGFVSFHLKISVCLTGGRKGHFRDWRTETRGGEQK